jgi:transposase
MTTRKAARAASGLKAQRRRPCCQRAKPRGGTRSPVVDNHIEIELAGGHRMRISGGYDPEALSRLIRGLTA